MALKAPLLPLALALGTGIVALPVTLPALRLPPAAATAALILVAKCRGAAIAGVGRQLLQRIPILLEPLPDPGGHLRPRGANCRFGFAGERAGSCDHNHSPRERARPGAILHTDGNGTPPTRGAGCRPVLGTVMRKGGSIKPGDGLDPRHDLVEDHRDARPGGGLAWSVDEGQVFHIGVVVHRRIMRPNEGYGKRWSG